MDNNEHGHDPENGRVNAKVNNKETDNIGTPAEGEARRPMSSAERQELYRQRAERRVHTERLRRRRKKIVGIGLAVSGAVLLVVLIVAGAVFINDVVIPKRHYDAAQELYDGGEYLKAYDAFIALGDYTDALARADECIIANARAVSGRDDVVIGDTKSMPWYSLDEIGMIKLDSDIYKGGNTVIVPDVFDGKLVRGVAEKGFYRADFMASVTLPASVSSIGERAFYACTSLTEILLPDNVTEIGESAFAECTALSSVSFSSKLVTLGQRTFINCTALTSVTLPEGVTSIGYRAFNNCTSLLSLSLPSTLASAGGYAFTGCEALVYITYPLDAASLASVFSSDDGSIITGCPGLVLGSGS